MMSPNRCLAGPAWRLMGCSNEWYRASVPTGMISTCDSTRQLIGNQRVLTINASDVQEAREALSTLLGDVDALSIRHASADEAMAWNASAMEAGMQQGFPHGDGRMTVRAIGGRLHATAHLENSPNQCEQSSRIRGMS